MRCKNSGQKDTCEDAGLHTMSVPEQVLKVVVAGSVDHGKSTLLGRLLMDLGQIAQERVDLVHAVCRQKGVDFEPGFLLDALEEEQTQGISIDTTRVLIKYGGRQLLLIDVPGHQEFLRNMTSGACDGDLAILIVDAQEGLKQQTTTHARILSLLGLRKVICVINKMDQCAFAKESFDKICGRVRSLLDEISLDCDQFIPVCSLSGENLVKPTERAPWYQGGTLIEAVNKIVTNQDCDDLSQPFRMLLQDIYKFDAERYYVGQVVTGRISQGEAVLFAPSDRVSRIKAFKSFPEKNIVAAQAGDSVALILEDQIFVERGEVVARPYESPEVVDSVVINAIWLAQEPLEQTKAYTFKLGTAEVGCRFSSIRLDTATDIDGEVANGTFFKAELQLDKPLALELNFPVDKLCRFVLCTPEGTAAAGIITRSQTSGGQERSVDENVLKEAGYVSRQEREERQKHKGAVLWLTGLSGSGKSTLAKGLERELVDKDTHVITLDADNLRNGLCCDLGFSPAQRSENVRRIAHVAKLLAEQGTLVIVACLSPYAKDRRLARALIGADDFFEIHVDCPLDVCILRDPKGLYAKASKGLLPSLSGFSSPYQRPFSPDLHLDTSRLSLDQETSEILNFLKAKGIAG